LPAQGAPFYIKWEMKTLLWKSYFWAILALDMISFVMPMDRRMWETVEMGFFVVALIGLFGYCWKKQILNRVFWQIFFVAFLCWMVVYFFILPPLSVQETKGSLPPFAFVALAVATVALHVPLATGLFFYSFRRADIWQA
jgi:hypothetical protein